MTGDEIFNRIATSIARQSAMTTIGAELIEALPGLVVIALPHADHLLQQNSFVHGGVIGMIADSAAGYAALTMMPADKTVLTSEYKINLLAPAIGERFVAEGRVVRAGKRVFVAMADVFAETGAARKAIAVLLGTMMVVDKVAGMVD